MSSVKADGSAVIGYLYFKTLTDRWHYRFFRRVGRERFSRWSHGSIGVQPRVVGYRLEISRSIHSWGTTVKSHDLAFAPRQNPTLPSHAVAIFRFPSAEGPLSLWAVDQSRSLKSYAENVSRYQRRLINVPDHLPRSVYSLERPFNLTKRSRPVRRASTRTWLGLANPLALGSSLPTARSITLLARSVLHGQDPVLQSRPSRLTTRIGAGLKQPGQMRCVACDHFRGLRHHLGRLIEILEISRSHSLPHPIAGRDGRDRPANVIQRLEKLG